MSSSGPAATDTFGTPPLDAPAAPAPESGPPVRPPARPVIVTPRPPRRPSARVIRRRRTVAAVAAALVAALLAVWLSPVGDRLSGLVPSGPGAATPPPAASVLLAWPTADESGAVAVLLGAPGERQGSALLIPGNTQVEVPSFGSATLGAALRSGGAETLDLAVENALGYEAGDVLALDAATLAGLFSPAAPFPVRLRGPVRIGDRSFSAAGTALPAEDAALLVTTHADDTTELDHLVVVHAVLEGWFTRLDAPTLAATREALTARLGMDRDQAERVAGVLTDLASRHVTFDSLDVIPLGLPGDLYRVDDAGTAEEMAALFPGLAFGDGRPRVAVEILNGTGTAGIASAAARRLLPEGARVVRAGNAPSFGVEKTLLVLDDPASEPDARRLAKALGVGEVRMARNPLGAAAVSIVLGADFDPGGE